jgi:general secretion pathway protein F
MIGMTRFAYQALSPSGNLVAGEVEAPDEAAVVAQLHDQGLLPISAAAWRADTGPRFALSLRGGALRGHDLALFSQQLARLLKAHLPLDRALDILVGLADNRALQTALRATLARVRDGSSLAEAMEAQGRAFPGVYISMIHAGETGGALQAVVARAAEFLTRSEAMRQRVISALIYPIVLLVVAGISVSLILTVVLPEFEPFFKDSGMRLPQSTLVVMAAGDILRDDWALLLPAAAFLALAVQRLMRLPYVASTRDRFLLGLPLLRDLITKFEVGRFSRTFGTLRANGVPAPAALSLAGRTIGNRAIAGAVDTVAARFKEGGGLSTSLAATSRFPELATQLIRIGEETGRLEEMLAEIAEIYDQEVQRTLERLLTLLVPVLTIGMGFVIAFIIAAVMTAMININQLAQ